MGDAPKLKDLQEDTCKASENPCPFYGVTGQIAGYDTNKRPLVRWVWPVCHIMPMEAGALHNGLT